MQHGDRSASAAGRHSSQPDAALAVVTAPHTSAAPRFANQEHGGELFQMPIPQRPRCKCWGDPVVRRPAEPISFSISVFAQTAFQLSRQVLNGFLTSRGRLLEGNETFPTGNESLWSGYEGFSTGNGSVTTLNGTFRYLSGRFRPVAKSSRPLRKSFLTGRERLPTCREGSISGNGATFSSLSWPFPKNERAVSQ
jgi:hypothetical protein